MIIYSNNIFEKLENSDLSWSNRISNLIYNKMFYLKKVTLTIDIDWNRFAKSANPTFILLFLFIAVIDNLNRMYDEKTKQTDLMFSSKFKDTDQSVRICMLTYICTQKKRIYKQSVSC